MAEALWSDMAEAKGRVSDYYAHIIELLPLVANAAGQSGSVTISDDGDFIITEISAVVTAADNVTFLPDGQWPFTVQLTDTGAGRQLTDKAVHFGNIAGTARQPFKLPRPKFLERATTVAGVFANLSGTAYNVRLTLHGVKLFGRRVVA